MEACAPASLLSGALIPFLVGALLMFVVLAVWLRLMGVKSMSSVFTHDKPWYTVWVAVLGGVAWFFYGFWACCLVILASARLERES